MVVCILILIISVVVILMSPLQSSMADTLCFDTKQSNIPKDTEEQSSTMVIKVGNTTIQAGQSTPKKEHPTENIEDILSSEDPNKYKNVANLIAKNKGKEE